MGLVFIQHIADYTCQLRSHQSDRFRYSRRRENRFSAGGGFPSGTAGWIQWMETRTDNCVTLIIGCLILKLFVLRGDAASNAKKNCLDCIVYCNMFPDDKYGLGFEIEEVMEALTGFSTAVHPVDECAVAMSRMRKDFVKKATE